MGAVIAQRGKGVLGSGALGLGVEGDKVLHHRILVLKGAVGGNQSALSGLAAHLHQQGGVGAVAGDKGQGDALVPVLLDNGADVIGTLEKNRISAPLLSLRKRSI